MAEWILQYETVCRRQDQYLQQIKELRQQFRTRADDSPAQSRDGSPFSTKSSKSSGSSVRWKPSRMPLIKLSEDNLAKKACILHPRRKHKEGKFYGDYWQSRHIHPKPEAPDFLMAPKTMISNTYTQKHAKESTSLPPIGEFDRNKTDYEPIEHIAKRNKLNLSKYLKEGQNWTRAARKDSVDMSDVVVQSTKIV